MYLKSTAPLFDMDVYAAAMLWSCLQPYPETMMWAASLALLKYMTNHISTVVKFSRKVVQWAVLSFVQKKGVTMTVRQIFEPAGIEFFDTM